MTRQEFVDIRKHLDRTQKEAAALLGVSLKAVQSFEQGWRNIPDYIQRHLLLLLARFEAREGGLKNCWEATGCPESSRSRCPAFTYGCGDLCFCICGTFSRVGEQKAWGEKMEICRQCDRMKALLATIRRGPDVP